VSNTKKPRNVGQKNVKAVIFEAEDTPEVAPSISALLEQCDARADAALVALGNLETSVAPVLMPIDSVVGEFKYSELDGSAMQQALLKLYRKISDLENQIVTVTSRVSI
jgi:hypothetical protein